VNSRLTAAAALTLAGASVAAAAFEPERERPARTSDVVQPRVAPAGAFLDSVGVNTHFNYADTAYLHRDTVLARLRELGVRHVRDAAPHEAPALAAGLRGAADLGVRLTLGAGDVRIRPADGVRASEEAVGDAVTAYEGPNEIDNGGRPDWPVKLRTQMSELRSAVGRLAETVPVVGPSLMDTVHHATVDDATFDQANLHPYPGALPPERPLAEAVAALRSVGVHKPVVFTETGYHNALAATTGQPASSEAAAAAYLPRALLHAFAMGVERTFVYELLDERPDPQLADPEQHFGLLRHDLSRKPAFRAIRNLLRAVRRSPGSARRRPPAAATAAHGALERLDLERADGSRVLALWRPVSVWDRHRGHGVAPAEQRVLVSWSRAVRDLAVHRPSRSRRAVGRRASARRITIALGGDVVLLSYR
jgi:hypothetical protein